MRDIKKEMEKGLKVLEKHPRLSLSATELHHIVEEAEGLPYESALFGLRVGVALGYRQGKTDAKKTDPATASSQNITIDGEAFLNALKHNVSGLAEYLEKGEDIK